MRRLYIVIGIAVIIIVLLAIGTALAGGGGSLRAEPSGERQVIVVAGPRA